MTFRGILKRYMALIAGLLILGFLLFTVGILWAHKRLSTLSFLGEMPTCQMEVAHLGGMWGVADVEVEVVDTPATINKGLMFREELPRGTGMLFAFREPGEVAFWMKNTLIPLDMIFFDAKGDMRNVHFNAKPLDETPIPGGSNIQYVLEVGAGEIQRMGLGTDTTIRHPRIEQENARWKC